MPAQQLRLGEVFGISPRVLSRNAAAFGVLALTFNLPWEVYWDYTNYFADLDPIGVNPLVKAAESMATMVAQSALTERLPTAHFRT